MPVGVLGGSKADFAIILFVGLIIHSFFAECLNRAPGMVLEDVDYVKKVVFPLEILPCVAMGSASFHTAITLVVLLVAQLIINQYLAWTAIFFPLIALLLIQATMGLSWFLSSLGFFMRDISQFAGIFTMLLLFMPPVFYPLSAAPKEYQVWLQLNPLAFIIEEGRNTICFGRMPDWIGLIIAMIIGIIITRAGFWWFQKIRKGFADVL